MNKIFEAQLVHLQRKWPQAHVVKGQHGEHLIAVPNFKLPECYSAAVCTLLFVAPPGYPGAVPAHFWIDVPDLTFNGDRHRWSNTVNPIPGFPAWRDLTWFGWHLQRWNPNRDSLLTIVHAISNSLAGAAEIGNQIIAAQGEQK